MRASQSCRELLSVVAFSEEVELVVFAFPNREAHIQSIEISPDT
jgi:hypothetical protein